MAAVVYLLAPLEPGVHGQGWGESTTGKNGCEPVRRALVFVNKPLLCRRFVSSFVVGRRSLFQGFVGTAFFFISLWVHRPPFCGGSLAGVWRSPACLPFDQHKFLLHHFQSTANDTRRGSSSADDWSDDGNAVRCCGGGVGGDSALCFVMCVYELLRMPRLCT